MTVIGFHINRWLGTTRAAINEIRPSGADLARPRLFALLIGGAVVCASLAMTASVNSADARPGHGGGHGHGGHGYGGHGYGHGYTAMAPSPTGATPTAATTGAGAMRRTGLRAPIARTFRPNSWGP